MPTITIIHTADLHGKLHGPASTALAHLIGQHPNALVLDSGDAVGVGNLNWLRDNRTLRTMASIGYDAMCIGNRETHVWARLMASKLGPPPFPMLCANLQPQDSVPVQPYLITEKAGTRVAVLGLTVPMVRPGSWPTRLGSLVFEDPIAAARAHAPALRQQADLLILLTHLGLELDRRLAEEVPGIDLILGGHDHVATHTPVPAGSTVIIHPGANGRRAAIVKIDVSTAGAKLVSAELAPLQ